MAVELRPMTSAEYEAWLGPAIEGYAESFVANGILGPDEARARGEKDFAELLTDGPETADHDLWTAWDGEMPVGVLWVMTTGKPPQRRAFIYDIEVREQHRRRGYARGMIDELTALARADGVASIGLNVFGHNQGAIDLYRKVGFEVTSMQMKLTL